MDNVDNRAGQVTELTSLLATYAEPAVLLDPQYCILGANEAYHRVYGDGGDSLIGRRCYQVSHGYSVPCDQAGENCPLLHSYRTHEPRRVLHLHHTPRGVEHVDVQIYPIENQRGDVAYFLELLRPTRFASTEATGSGLVGRSAAFNTMVELIHRVAPSDVSALLVGESGTGKELVAKALHAASARAAQDFVAVDCSGLTETLFESELFGHRKGAFTGALSNRIGLVEAAEGGTLFLDEIGDVPLHLQVKLLRLLETGAYRRVGSAELREADFRLVCATHRDLELMVRQGRFREDLYYRISAFPIELPSLQQRCDDIPLLVEALLKRISPQKAFTLEPPALDCLKRYRFPGNVRELRNMLERATMLADGDVIAPGHLPERCRESLEPAGPAPIPDQIVPLRAMEQRYLQWARGCFEGDNKALAKALQISERTLYRKMRGARAKTVIGSRQIKPVL